MLILKKGFVNEKKSDNIKNMDEMDEILNRSIAEVLPSKEEFKKVLLSGKKLRIYIGCDATGTQLHIGNATNFMILERLRQLGHEVIVLFGDFTALIGDPSDKTAARIMLTKEQIEENMKTWKSQVEKVLDFNEKNNPAKILKNSEWNSKLKFSDVINLASNFTVQQMLERDMFEERLKQEKPIYLHEFLYPLTQGYDSVAMDVDVEMGGTDQKFNMLAGRTLQKKYHNKEKFVITTTLLVNPKTGKKLMSKSEGTYIGLNDEPDNMFGKVMNLPDEAIIQVFIDCTYVPLDEIKQKETDLKNNKVNPMNLKLDLAEELVKIYHGQAAAEKARENFIKLFQKKEIPEDIKEIKTKTGESLEDTLIKNKIIPSKSEFRRLIKAGAIDIDNQTINDVNYFVKQSIVVRVGKKKFLRIVI